MPDTPDRTTSRRHWPATAENPLGGEDPVSAEELALLQEQPHGDITALSTPAGVFTYVSAASRGPSDGNRPSWSATSPRNTSIPRTCLPS